MKTILTIDQSTSATKAILFGIDGSEIAQATAEHRQIYPRPEFVEHDAEEIWRNTQRVMREVSPADERPACLSITNQRETIVLFDRATGMPVHHAIVWQCRRGAGICAELKASEEMVRRKTGLPIDPYFSAPKLAWVLRNDSRIRAGVQAGSILLGTIDAYLIYRLTGGKVFATDATNASRTMLFNIQAGAWDDELCAMFGVPKHALPEVRSSHAGYGETPDGLPIIGVMGDSQGSLFAQRCFEPGGVKVTFGTGSSVLMNAGNTMSPAANGICTTVGWRLAETTYSYEGVITYSAATLAWLKDQLGIFSRSDEIEPMAVSIPDNGGVYLVPAFAGLGAPHWSPAARGTIVGLTAYSDKRHLVRAALESIGYQIADVLESMGASSGTPIRQIQADGGPTQNAFLMQFVADMTGAELVVSSVPNGSALGAAMMGMLGSGACRSLDDLKRLPRTEKRYCSQMPAGQVKQLRDGWNRAVRQALAT